MILQNYVTVIAIELLKIMKESFSNIIKNNVNAKVKVAIKYTKRPSVKIDSSKHYV